MAARCNLYKMDKSAAEVARLFNAVSAEPGNAGAEVYPGYPGYVVAEGRVRQMTWGFPLSLKGKNGQALKPKPVNNTRADKLDSFMWRYSFAERRCLIPVTEFAEAEGEKGAKTRTWFGIHDQPIFAWAGMWKDSAEWGPVYSGLMTDCNDAIRPVHDRMPVLLMPEDYDRWLHGSLDDVRAFQDRCFPNELIEMERTRDPWIRKTPTFDQPSLI